MDVIYKPPVQDELECNMLQRNFLTCLKEKSVKDQVPKMNCNVELLLWFNLECPDQYKKFKNPEFFRKTFVAEKQLESQPNKPKWVKLGWK